MNDLVIEQLGKLKDYDYEFKESSIIFKKSVSHKYTDVTYRVIFKDYFVTPYEGFDFHVKFNNNIAPPELVMFGTIVKTTDSMYLFNLKSETSTQTWSGWCPKKSCTIEVM